ncbi:MAG: GNAT family N-acetyltransferase [Methanomassiliicoccaceae archaeon]|jgi:acyl-CoA hydrolase/RimJ/RimL family protein N-acetyltransferase|nr:GNAT family N-acetyltransferase [Methanomassiliicoccaceae archaeon]
MYWRDEYERKVSTPKKALAAVKPGRTIFIGGGCARPKYILESLLKKDTSRDNKVLSPFNFLPSPFADEEIQKNFRVNSFFMDTEVEEGVSKGRMDFTPIHTSDVPFMLESGRISVNIAIVQVSPPDMHGYCSLGTSVDMAKSAVSAASVVIAEVNRQMPRTLGDSFIHISEIDHILEVDYPVDHELDPEDVTEEVMDRIGKNVSNLVPDGATLQIGIGRVPDATLRHLRNKKHLGIHTEMFSDGVLDLVEAGVITGERKAIHPNKIITSFVIGSQRLMEFVDNNPSIEFHPSDYTNNPLVIARNSKMIAINTASAVDLTGQVLCDRTGFRDIDNPGGQADFARGASYARGRSIIVIPSTAENESKIIATIPEGAGVSMTREDVHYVITEHGVAHLRGKTLANRALELINIAHPDFRARLLDEAVKLGYLPEDQSKRPYTGKPYPAELELREVFKGTELLIRPVKPTDEDMVKELFYSFSEKTIHQRFMSRRVIQSRIERMSQVNIDYDSTMSFGFFQRVGGKVVMVGLCGYEYDAKKSSAEVSFAVRDDWQGKGLGTYMLNLLIRVAKSRNVKMFTAEVLATNAGMLNLFYRTGLDVNATLEDDVYIVSFNLVKQSM